MLKVKKGRKPDSHSRLLMAVADTARRVSIGPWAWNPYWVLTRAHIRLLMRHERQMSFHMGLGDIAGSVKEGTGMLRELCKELFKRRDEDAGSNFASFCNEQEGAEKAYADWLGDPSQAAARANEKHWVVTSYGGGENGAWTIRRKREDEYLDASGFAKAIGPVKPVKARDYSHWKSGLEHMLEMAATEREGSLYPDDGPSSNDNGGASEQALDEAFAQDCAHCITHVRTKTGIGLKVVPRNPVQWNPLKKRWESTNERVAWTRVKHGKVERTEEDVANGILPGRVKLTFYRRKDGAIHEYSIVEGQGININARFDKEARRAKLARAPMPYTSREHFREVYRLPLAPKVQMDIWPRLEDRHENLSSKGMLRGPIECTRGEDEWTWNWSKENGYYRFKANGDMVLLDPDVEKKVLKAMLTVIERTTQGCDNYWPCRAQVWREEVAPEKFRVHGKRQRRWAGDYRGYPVVITHCSICRLVSECVQDTRDWRFLQQEHSRGKFPIKGTTGNLRCLRCGGVVQEKTIRFRVAAILGRGVDNVVWTATVDVWGSKFMKYMLGRQRSIGKAWGHWYWTPRDEKPEVELGQES